MSEIKVNKISPRTACGTTILGDSGDTISIPAGVTISNSGTASGFGSTGEVSWNTTKITADPGPAVNGVGYFADTSVSAFNVTLPASPSPGNVIAINDYAGNFATNAVTILRNGSNIQGSANDFILARDNVTAQFIYVDATQGWKIVFTGDVNGDGLKEAYVSATGGTESTSGDFKIHTFTGPGTFTVNCLATSPSNNVVDYLVIAGGGAGGSGGFGEGGGGGGAGGYRESPGTATGCFPVSPRGASPAVALPVSAQGYPIVVGGGGSGGVGPGGCVIILVFRLLHLLLVVAVVVSFLLLQDDQEKMVVLVGEHQMLVQLDQVTHLLLIQHKDLMVERLVWLQLIMLVVAVVGLPQ